MLPIVHIEQDQAVRLLNLMPLPSIVRVLPDQARNSIHQAVLQAFVPFIPEQAKQMIHQAVLDAINQLLTDDARNSVHTIIFRDPEQVILCDLHSNDQLYLFQALVRRASYNPKNHLQVRNDFLDIEVDASNRLRDRRLGIPISSDVLGEIDPLWIGSVRFPIQLARTIINRGLLHLFLRGMWMQDSLESTAPLCGAFREALLDRGSYNTAEGVARLDVSEEGRIYDTITHEDIHSDLLAGLSPDRLQQMPQEIARRIAVRSPMLFSSVQWSAVLIATRFQQQVSVVQTNVESNLLQLLVRGNSQQGNLPCEDHNTEEQKRETHRPTVGTHRQKNTPNRTRGSFVRYRDTVVQRQGEQRGITGDLHRPVVHLNKQQVHQHLRQLVQNQRKKDQPQEAYEDSFRKGGFRGSGNFKKE